MINHLVEKNSARGLLWSIRPYDHNKADKIAKKESISPTIAKIASIKSEKDQELIPAPKLVNLIPDPSKIKDLDIAVDKIIEIIGNKLEIGILTDYDVDGATSASLLYKYLLQLGYKVKHIYIPHRVLEGYGPNDKALEFFINKKIDLLIMTDCGATANKQLDELAKQNIPVIIIDHHKPFDNKLKCLAQINPHQTECLSKLVNLSACGLVFMLLIGINRKLRKLGIKTKHTEPNLFDLIELVALSTMADIVPLDNLNRAITLAGLRMINKKPSVAFLAFKNKQNINIVNEEDLSYKIAPLINAGARMSTPYLGFQTLIQEELNLANRQVDNLLELNNSRKTIQALASQKIIKKINRSDIKTVNLKTKNIILDSDKTYHLGMIGLIANEIANRFSVLAIIGGIGLQKEPLHEGKINKNDNNLEISNKGAIVRASLRLNDNLDFNIAFAINKAIDLGVIIKGGGHARAGGIEYYKQKEDDVYDFFNSEVTKNIQQTTSLHNLNIDLEIKLKQLTNDFYLQLSKLAPFGCRNDQPLFLIRKIAITDIKLINDQHSLVVIEKSNFTGVKAISFFSKRNGLHDFFIKNKSLLLDIVIKLSKDDYKNSKNTFQVQISDVRVAA